MMDHQMGGHGCLHRVYVDRSRPAAMVREWNAWQRQAASRRVKETALYAIDEVRPYVHRERQGRNNGATKRSDTMAKRLDAIKEMINHKIDAPRYQGRLTMLEAIILKELRNVVRQVKRVNGLGCEIPKLVGGLETMKRIIRDLEKLKKGQRL